MVFKNRYCKRCGKVYESSTKYGRYCESCKKPCGGRNNIKSNSFAFYLGEGFGNDNNYKDVKA